MHYLKKPWVLVTIGVVLGATVLYGTVSLILKKAKGVVSPADAAAAKAQGV